MRSGSEGTYALECWGVLYVEFYLLVLVTHTTRTLNGFPPAVSSPI
jgi:hypothetical protein